MFLFENEDEMNDFVKLACVNNPEEIQDAYDILINKGQAGELVKLSSAAAFFTAYLAGMQGFSPEETKKLIEKVAVDVTPVADPNAQGAAPAGAAAAPDPADIIADKTAKKVLGGLGVAAQSAAAAPAAGAAAPAGAPAAAPGSEDNSPEAIEQALAAAGVIPKAK